MEASVDNPFFLHIGNKVLLMYDPHHLLKNVRNNLKKTGFDKDSQSVEWRCIDELYALGSRNSVRMAQKLTQKHIDLPAFAALRVNYATQVFSNYVAACISTLITMKVLLEEANEAALFLERMDRLFSCLNSKTLHITQQMRHELSETSGHTEFFHSPIDWLVSPKSGNCLAYQDG